MRVLDLYAGGSGMRALRATQTIEQEIVVATCGGALRALEMNKVACLSFFFYLQGT